MNASILYIHGIGHASNPGAAQAATTAIKAQWDLALFGKDMQKQTQMVFWGDIAEASVQSTARVAKKRKAAEPDGLTAAGILSELNIDPADSATLMFVQALAGALQIPLNGPLPQTGAASIGKTILPLPASWRRAVAERFLRSFLKDVAAYFFKAGVRTETKARLIAAIKQQRKPFVLVAHSLGTVIAFDVLSELEARQDAALLVTLGSPLGIQEVQDILQQDQGRPLMVPPGVRGWHNFSDRLDPVALDAGLANDFEERNGVRIKDARIVNERTKTLLQFNPHAAAGYLAHLQVRRSVHHASGFDTASRFVVARDVAEEFVDSTRRQSVLVEVLEPGYWASGETLAAMRKREARQGSAVQTLNKRIEHLAASVAREIDQDGSPTAKRGAQAITSNATRAARIIKLRKYVSAHLTPSEIAAVASQHKEFNVYAIWRNAEKRKLLLRSHGPVKADAARASYAARGAGITWAVLDTGARWDHPQLRDNIIAVLDCTTDSDTPEVLYDVQRSPVQKSGKARERDIRRGDRDGHGTHVAGIIAGDYRLTEDRQELHYQGLAPQTRLLVYKVLDDDGRGNDAWIIKAIDDIHRRNTLGLALEVHGVNLSLGGPFDASVYGCGFSPICKELRDLWRQGTLICVAAGNEGQIQIQTQDGGYDLNTQLSIGDPANLQDCIAVGSVNADKPYLYGISYFSSRGPTADGRLKPDVVAPGERIVSCNADFNITTKGRRRKETYDNLYIAASGTSMACPHVSGLLAAFLSVRREYIGRPDEVKQILLANCNDLGRDRYHQGAGLPNLMKMLTNT